MWLINTSTLKLKYFQACPAGKYAILSHRWEDKESSFQLFKSGKDRNRKGFWKIWKCCEQARKQGLKYAWVDTCCIDKKSSSELSEAINSMFGWYAKAAECYIYMSDVFPDKGKSECQAGNEVLGQQVKISSSNHPLTCSDKERLWMGALVQRLTLSEAPGYESQSELSMQLFNQSKWFERGWTLQELIAPRKKWFFNYHWNLIGDHVSLQKPISEVTGIPWSAISHSQSLNKFCIAQKMSWAARRDTTRPEDRAYSLLGIFDANMPLIYGEGHKAFQRLQEILVAKIDDETIFAWTEVPQTGCGPLAPSPDNFLGCGGMWRQHMSTNRPIPSMTCKGLAITAHLVHWKFGTYILPLQCGIKNGHGDKRTLGIFVQLTTVDKQYVRVSIDGVSTVALEGYRDPNVCFYVFPESDYYGRSEGMATRKQELYVSHTDLNQALVTQRCGFRLSNADLWDFFRVDETCSPEEGFLQSKQNLAYCVGAHVTRDETNTLFVLDVTKSERSFTLRKAERSCKHLLGNLKLGFDFNWNPVCFIAGNYLNDDQKNVWNKHLWDAIEYNYAHD